MRLILVVAAFVISIIPPSYCAGAAEQTFEVASVRPTGLQGIAIPTRWGPMYFVSQSTLKGFIRMAYSLDAYQIKGGPQWMDEENYEIDAKAAPPASIAEIRKMLVALLRDRFKLQMHWTSEKRAAYALIRVQNKKNLEASKADTRLTGVGAIQVSRQKVVVHGASMRMFASFLTGEMGRPVLDQTGLDGGYDFTLPLDETAPGMPSMDESGAIISALKSIGLKLESKKASIPMLVVDRAERPTGN